MKSTVYFAFLFLLTGIQQTAFAGGIPKTMPDDFTIYYHSHIGYNSNYRLVDLSLKECSVMLNDSALSMYTFTIAKEELSTLYSTLFSLKAFTLKYKTTKYGDRGGEKIEYLIAGKKYQVNNQGPYIIAPSHLNHFIESIDLITACADRHRH